MRISKVISLLFGLVLAGSVRAAVGQYVVNVPSPNRTDDTAAIQQALDTCVQQHPAGCVVQLAAGTYHTRQLVAYNFHGTFKGLGMHTTTIEALPYLPVTIDWLQPCQPNTTTCLWPTLMIFVDGDINISDLSVHMTATDGTATDPPGQIDTGIRLMGQYSTTNVHIDRFEMEGRPDIIYGFNVNNGIMYTGELSSSSANPIEVPCGAPVGFYFVSGSYSVRNSTFRSMGEEFPKTGACGRRKLRLGVRLLPAIPLKTTMLGIDLEFQRIRTSKFRITCHRESASACGLFPGFRRFSCRASLRVLDS